MKIIGAILILVGIIAGLKKEKKVTGLAKLYGENTEFADYVDKYASHRGLTVNAALRHKIVAIVAKEKFDYEV